MQRDHQDVLLATRHDRCRYDSCCSYVSCCRYDGRCGYDSRCHYEHDHGHSIAKQHRVVIVVAIG